jgi:hypothetical protein
MCRMMPGNWPTPRDSHSTRSGLFCKSCTAPIQQQCHQSRTSRCSSHPSREAARAGAKAARAAKAAKAAEAADSGCAACADGGCAQEEVVNRGCEATTEIRNPSSRSQDCTRYTVFLGRHRRKHRQRR